MSTNISEIPFTEINERVQKLGRIGDNSMEKIRGTTNDVYIREIPAKFDWNFLMAESSLTTKDEYHTGSVSMNTGDTTVVGTNTTFDANMVGSKIKITGVDAVYEITVYLSATSLTISPAMQGASNVSNTSYSIYKDRYSLAGNFDRFPKPGGVYRWAGGKKQILPEVQYANYINDEYQATASTPSKTRIIGIDTLGSSVVELIPPPKYSRVYGYDYLKTLCPMYETTAGTISSITSSSTLVSASGANFTKALTDGTFFFRVDNLGEGADSTWYRILSIQNDNQLTLATVFANTSILSASYTISAAPKMPPRLHIGIIYGSLRQLTVDQSDPNAQFYNMQYAQVMSDAKKIYVSRPYSQDVDGIMTDYRYRK